VAQTPNPTVKLETSAGDITIELDAAKAPLTTANFVQYVQEKFYDGTIFHRVIPGFMIQGGGMTADMREKRTRASIQNEAANGLKNLRGSIAMARTNVVDSATAQFFINLADNEFLNHSGKSPDRFGYAVFGKVIAGMEVVDAIAKVATGRRGPHDDVPVEAVTITSASVL
jgi:cyclophilin family peptidyl-prolyl cis-trans isomerase